MTALRFQTGGRSKTSDIPGSLRGCSIEGGCLIQRRRRRENVCSSVHSVVCRIKTVSVGQVSKLTFYAQSTSTVISGWTCGAGNSPQRIWGTVWWPQAAWSTHSQSSPKHSPWRRGSAAVAAQLAPRRDLPPGHALQALPGLGFATAMMSRRLSDQPWLRGRCTEACCCCLFVGQGTSLFLRDKGEEHSRWIMNATDLHGSALLFVVVAVVVVVQGSMQKLDWEGLTWKLGTESVNGREQGREDHLVCS